MGWKFISIKFRGGYGQSLSPVLAKLHMEYFETEILPIIAHMPSLWLSYTGNSFVIWLNEHDSRTFLPDLDVAVPTTRF